MTGLVSINGINAYTLFDSGSEADCVSSDFATVAKLKTFPLDAPVGLQMGCKGSRSSMSYGARAEIKFNDQISFPSTYLDVANLDRYDLILGMPFMRKHSCDLLISSRHLIYGKHRIRCLTQVQDAGVSSSPMNAREYPTPVPTSATASPRDPRIHTLRK